jgi:NAD(P)-dependent dehydrogenase (short-subunit alcohol dehydrogenase family)
MLTRAYSGMRAYAQSKLAQVMMTFDLAQKLERDGSVSVNCLHPATYMDTNMVRQAGIAPANTVETGADAVLHIAVGTEFGGRSGVYLDGQQPARAHAQAYDLSARERLFEVSCQLCGLSP